MFITLLAIFILCFSLTTINASDNNINTVNMEDDNLKYENNLYQSSEIETNADNILNNENFALKGENNDNNEINANPLLNDKTSNIEPPSVDNSPKTPTNIPSQSAMDEDGKISTKIEGNDTNFNYKSGTHYKVRLLDKNLNPLVNQNITFIINKKVYNQTTDKNGIAKLLINLPVDTYRITYQYYGNENYTGCFGGSKINVLKTKPEIVVSNNKIVYKSGKNLIILLEDKYGNPLVNTNIFIKINGKTYKKKTNKKGNVSLGVSKLKLGKYPTKISYKGGNNYKAVSKSIDVYVYKIKTILHAKSESFRYGLGQNYTVRLLNQKGVGIPNKNVYLYINGERIKSKTNENGVARFKIAQNTGKYSTYIKFFNEDEYYGSSKNTVISVIKGKTYIKASNSNTSCPSKAAIKIKFYNANNQPIKNTVLYTTINKKTYKKVTNNTGEIALHIQLDPGNYKTMIYYEGSANLKTAQKNITVTVNKGKTNIEGKDASIIEYNDEYYQVKLTDKNKNPLSGKTVTFNVNNLNLTAKTNSNGIAKVKVNTDPGNYTITYKSTSDKYYKSASGSSKLTVNVDTRIRTKISGEALYLLKGNSGNFIISLVNAKNNVGLANKNVTITYNGKNAIRTTDNNGQISLAISKNLKPGSYSISFKFESPDEGEYKPSSGKSTIKVIELKSGMTLTKTEVKALGLPTITVSGKPSCLHCYYEMEKGKLVYKNYTRTYVNWCPFCEKIGKLTWNPKHVYEGEITCGSGTSKDHYAGGCDADFCAVCGYDKTVDLRAKLIRVVSG